MEVTSFEDARGIESINLLCWTSENGAAGVVDAEEKPHSGILE
jgi:hypothetical protein